MTASFPGSVKSFSMLVDLSDSVLAAHQNAQQDEISAIETFLLENPVYAFCARLSLSSTLAVPSAELTAQGTLYLHPFRGTTIDLYNGTYWNRHKLSSAISLSLAGLPTASTCYDIFVYDNSGTLTLDAVAWTSATARATALATQDGIYVKSGSASHRYAGTIYVDSSKQSSMEYNIAINTTTMGRRHVWNYYNRLDHSTKKVSTTSHTYTSATYRKWNNTDVLGLEIVIGVTEDDVSILAGGNQDDGATMDVGINWASGGGILIDLYNSSSSPISAFIGGFLRRSGITEGLCSINVLEAGNGSTGDFTTGIIEILYGS